MGSDWYVPRSLVHHMPGDSAWHRVLTYVDEGALAELMGNLEDAMSAYEHALRANPNSIPAMNAISLVLRTREEFSKAADYLQAILKLDNTNGEAWGSLG